MEREVYPATLTQKQALFLADMLGQAVYASREDDAAARWQELMRQVFAAVLSKEPTPVAFTQEDLWTIQQVANSVTQYAGEWVGLALLQMCARGILELSANPAVKAATELIQESKHA